MLLPPPGRADEWRAGAVLLLQHTHQLARTHPPTPKTPEQTHPARDAQSEAEHAEFCQLQERMWDVCGWRVSNAAASKKSTLCFSFFLWIRCKWWDTHWLWKHKMLANKAVISPISVFSLTHHFSALPCILALSQWTTPSFCLSLSFVIWMLFLTHLFSHAQALTKS